MEGERFRVLQQQWLINSAAQSVTDVTRCTRKCFTNPSTALLSPNLTTPTAPRPGRDTLPVGVRKKKNVHRSSAEFFSREISSNSRERVGAGEARGVRQTRVEWPFAKLLGRKREIGCNPCAANRKCRTNIFVPFSFPTAAFIRVSFSPFRPPFTPLAAASTRRRISSPPRRSPPPPFSQPAHRKSLPRRQLSAGGTADWLRRKRVISVIRKAVRRGDSTVSELTFKRWSRSSIVSYRSNPISFSEH